MRKHTKRKLYGLIYDPIAYVKQGMSATPETHLDKVRFRELCAIEALAKGNGGINEWRELTEMLNIAETMGKTGIGPEVLPVCQKAQAELLTAAKRFKLTRRMGLTATGLCAVRELFAYHDAQRTAITKGEYEKAITTTANRVRSQAGEVVDVSDVV